MNVTEIDRFGNDLIQMLKELNQPITLMINLDVPSEINAYNVYSNHGE